MDLKSCVQYLLDNNYAVLIQDQVVLTRKVNDELRGKSTITTAVNDTTPAVRVASSDERKDVWNKFCTDAEIPYRVNAPNGGNYTVRQYSPANAIRLMKIIASVDYNRLVESTKNYYKTVTYKALLSNYLEKDIWRHEYDNWKGVVQKTDQNDGSSLFED